MIAVARLDELREGDGLAVRVDGRRVALFRVGDRIYAIDDSCPHRGGPISEGWLEQRWVYCPLHAWCFDLETGAMRGNPALKIPVYRVEVRAGEVWVGSASLA